MTNPSDPVQPRKPTVAPQIRAAQPAESLVRVLIVDDSAFMRSALRRMLESDPKIRVIATGKTGEEAVNLCKQFNPDVVTLDVEMPVMDGLSALKRIRAECANNPAVLMCSSLTKAGSLEALTAMRSGAADVIAKDGSSFSLNTEAMRDDLLAKIKAIAAGRLTRIGTASTVHTPANFALLPEKISMLVIGSSTGGPPVLETLVTSLPSDLHVPVLIAQHMPPLFTQSLAERLNKEARVPVLHGENGMRVESGKVYIAPGGQHMRVKGPMISATLDINTDPKHLVYKPSVDELYSSAAKLAGSRVLGIVCTGMGEDGALGARDIKAVGGRMIAQDVSSCVVYGMPKAVAQAGLADAAMNPDEMAKLLSGLRRGARAAA